MDFTQEERMLMMIYNPGSREELKPGGISGRTGNNEGAAPPRRETASASDRYRDR